MIDFAAWAEWGGWANAGVSLALLVYVVRIGATVEHHARNIEAIWKRLEKRS